MPRLVGLCAGVALGAFALGAPAGTGIQAQGPAAVPLGGDTEGERRLSAGEEHQYALKLTAGEYVRVNVVQHGIDVVIHVCGPDGSVLADVNDAVLTGEEEHVDIAAGAAGNYLLAIAAAPGAMAAGSYLIHRGSRRPAMPADRSVQESRTARVEAARLEQAGRFDEARVLFENALELAEDAAGPDDPFVTTLVADLAGNALERRDNDRSRALYQRALLALDASLGADHPKSAMVRSRLAVLMEREGSQRPQAEALLRRAMAVIEQRLGPDHPWFISCLATLAMLRDDAGDLEQSEAINLRALAIAEMTHETDSVVHANLLNNLGNLYRQKGDYTRAQGLVQQSLAIGERLRGPDSYYVATALQNLGIIARELKDYPTARHYYERALAIREATVGPDHPDAAQLINNLANVYRATGDNARALETHFRALRIWDSRGGPYARGTLLSVGNIARTYASDGDIARAIAFQRRVDAILEGQLALNLASGSERQKLAFANSASERTDRTISLNLHLAPGNADASALAALVILQRKGRVLDAMTDTFATMRQRVAASNDQKLLDQLKTATADLARFALNPPEAMNPEERRRALEERESRKERLEVELGERSAEVRTQLQPVTLEAVQAAVPDDAALLEFAVFRPFDPSAERNAEAYGPPHYAGYVVRRQGTPRGFDLGEARVIDEHIAALRQALRDPLRDDVKEHARAVDHLVLESLRAAIGDATRLLISPDGELNLVPFEAFVDEHGRYLVTRYATTYLTSGRDLLRLRVPRGSRSQPVIVADPLFGEPGVSEPRSSTAAAARETAGDDLAHAYFAPLAASAEEARAIKGLFPEAMLLTGADATKAALQGVAAPRVLHIASHGFFLQDTRDSQRPLLRSGLALAGANLVRDSARDGILTALEASGLDLWGTKLVTLSGCDTGVGEVHDGEGVYGLRRAFVLAGTETLVMSLWTVSDRAARETMVAYYTRLRLGVGRGDALRQAKLDILKRPNRQHPFYWATFIQSGEWANLDGAR